MAAAHSVFIVADVLEREGTTGSPFSADMPTSEEVDRISFWLQSAGFRVAGVSSVVEFVDRASPYCADIVLPLWRAGESRNRTGIVPAVCEARSIRYVGADAYGQVVCQDKALSKALLRTCGLEAPRDVTWRRVEDVNGRDPVPHLKLPVVVKPLYSACSIGVDERSLCASAAEAVEKAEQLFVDGLGPVICEEFVPGDEISLCVVEMNGAIIERCVSRHYDDKGACPFRGGLFTFDAKTKRRDDWRVGSESTEVVPASTWAQVEALVASLGKLDLCRIDGRLEEGRFVVIELTPDIHLGLDSLFLGGFAAAGRPPADVLGTVVEASLRNQGCQGAVR